MRSLESSHPNASLPVSRSAGLVNARRLTRARANTTSSTRRGSVEPPVDRRRSACNHEATSWSHTRRPAGHVARRTPRLTQMCHATIGERLIRWDAGSFLRVPPRLPRRERRGNGAGAALSTPLPSSRCRSGIGFREVLPGPRRPCSVSVLTTRRDARPTRDDVRGHAIQNFSAVSASRNSILNGVTESGVKPTTA